MSRRCVKPSRAEENPLQAPVRQKPDITYVLPGGRVARVVYPPTVSEQLEEYYRSHKMVRGSRQPLDEALS